LVANVAAAVGNPTRNGIPRQTLMTVALDSEKVACPFATLLNLARVNSATIVGAKKLQITIKYIMKATITQPSSLSPPDPEAFPRESPFTS